MNWIVQIFLLLGIVFSVMGNLGVLIFPDVYTRLQASSTCSTTSVFSIFIAAMLSAGFSPLSGKILVITIFFLISSPVASYIIARYAWQADIPVWRTKQKDVKGIVEILRKGLKGSVETLRKYLARVWSSAFRRKT